MRGDTVMRMIAWLGGAAGAAALLSSCSSIRVPDRSDLVATPSACAGKRFDIYFAEDEARLTEAARMAIGLTASQLRGCRIQTVRVLGLADATGGAAANQTLSERRAIAVARALADAGWPTPAFELSAAGASGAITASGVEEPLRRRTEVLVEVAPL